MVDAQLNPKRAEDNLVGVFRAVRCVKSLIEALTHAGIQTLTKIDIQYIDAETLEREGVELLEGADAILVPSGFGERGFEGKICSGIRRQHKIPIWAFVTACTRW